MAGFSGNFTANLSSDATGSIVSSGVKLVIALTPRAKVKAGDVALDDAINKMRECEDIPPRLRKQLSKRITALRKERKKFPAHIGFFDFRLQYKIAKKAERYMADSLEAKADVVEISASSSLDLWNAIDTRIYAESIVDLPPSTENTPGTPRSSTPINDSFDSEPMTPRVSDFPEREISQAEPTNALTPPQCRRAGPSPPSPSGSTTDTLFNSPTHPPVAARRAWPPKNPFGGKTSNQKNYFSLELNKVERTGGL